MAGGGIICHHGGGLCPFFYKTKKKKENRGVEGHSRGYCFVVMAGTVAAGSRAKWCSGETHRGSGLDSLWLDCVEGLWLGDVYG